MSATETTVLAEPSEPLASAKGGDEPAIIGIIKIVLYVIVFVIILITVITIINYSLYTVYSIQAIFKEQTYADSPYFKQKDIYNYMLINYIHLLKKQKNNVTYEYYRSYNILDVNEFEKTNYDISNKISYTDTLVVENNTNMTIFYNLETKDKITNFEKNKHILEKWLITNVSNKDKEYYYLGNKYYTIKTHEVNPYIAIPDNVFEELNILHNIDDEYVLIPRGKPKETDRDAYENAIGLYDMYKKNVNTSQNIYGYFTKFLGEINPMNLMYMNDDKASHLYLQVNNNFYELVLMLVFVILLIIFISTIYTFYIKIITSLNEGYVASEADKAGDGSSDSVIELLMGKYIYYSLIILAIVAYCFIHSIIYKYLFVVNVYDRLYEMYNELIKPDTYISSCANTYRDTVKFNNVLDILKEMSHSGNVNIYNANQYTVVKLDRVAEVSVEKQLEEFSNVMLDINKNFTVSNFNYNYYTNKLFTTIFDEVNKASAATGVDDDYKSTLLFILVIYMYFINNNKEDPYIIIKLNKLIFGTVANIGKADIDKDIEYTLLLRSLVYEKLDIEKMRNYITNVRDGVMIWSAKNGSKADANITAMVTTKTDTFIGLFATTNDNLNFWTPVYFLNLYLAVEIGLNLLLILIVLTIISTYYDSKIIRIFIVQATVLIMTAIEELKTALIGVI
jgi:hypothetical protein